MRLVVRLHGRCTAYPTCADTGFPLDLEGSAIAAVQGDDLDSADTKHVVKEQHNVPSMEKGDEPLSQHKEEAVHEMGKLASTEDGLSLIQKAVLILVIVAICAWFMRSPRKASVAGRHGAYEKSIA